jgi:two-component system phosphate regulon sensor histidine kinase PhoR
MKRIATLRLLMFCSEALLCVFLATWLIAQWHNEEQNLRKDLRLKFSSVTRRVTDSTLKARINIPLQAGGHPASPMTVTIKSKELSERLPLPVQFQPAHPALVLHRSVWNNSRDSRFVGHFTETRDTAEADLLEGVRVIINSIVPDSILNMIAYKDTARITRMFQQALASDRQHFSLTWKSPKSNETPGTILLHSEYITGLYTIQVSEYYWFLFKKIAPQILFVLFLIAITAAAFILAHHSLQRERRLSLMRNNLVSNMSHELKTPVTTVKVALEALSDETVLQDAATTREYVNIANLELQRLELLINQTLNTSLLESGKLPVQKALIDMEDTVTGVINNMQPRIEKQRALLSLSFEGDDFNLQADKLHVQGVILNILDNALKYGGEGVRIQVVAKSDSHRIELSVSDNGPGIPKAYQHRVFEKFFRVPAGNIHNVKGYGLGLSYAAEVMRLHNGSILLSDTAGGGCTFTLCFPKDQRHEA